MSGAAAAATMSLYSIGELIRSSAVPWPDADSATARNHKNTRYKLYHIYAEQDAYHDYERSWKWGITRQEGSVRPQRQIPRCDAWFKAAESSVARCDWIWVREDINGWFEARALEAMYAFRYRFMYGGCPPGIPRCL